jgi:hypothetical protein
MSLQKLIDHFKNAKEFPISVDEIKAWIIKNRFQDEIYFYPVDVDATILRGLCKRYKYRKVPYGDPVLVTDVRYAASLSLCWQRFVCCKEMMHIFDNMDSTVITGEDLDKLTLNLTSPPCVPISDKEENILRAEKFAEAITLKLLAPLLVIEQLRSSYKDGSKSAYDVAHVLRVPEHYISLLFSSHYVEICKLIDELLDAS